MADLDTPPGGFILDNSPLAASQMETDEFEFPDPTLGLDTSAFVTSLAQRREIEEALETKDVKETREERGTLTERFKGLLGKLPGKARALQAEEERLGVSGQLEELQVLNSEIAQREAEFDNLIQQEQQRLASTGVIDRSIQELRTQKAVQIGALNSQKQASIGNIELARSIAERTIAMEFAPIEQEISNIRDFLKINREDLTAAEKEIADSIDETLAAQKAKIDEQKQERRDVFNLLVNNLGAGILLTDSLEEAVRKAKIAEPDFKDRLLTVSEAERFDVPFGTMLSDVRGEEVPAKPTVTGRRAVQKNRTTQIIRANVVEKLFGRKGKLKGVTRGELVTTIVSILTQEFDEILISESDVSKMIDDILEEKFSGLPFGIGNP